MPAEVEGISQGAWTESPSRAEQMAFPVAPCIKQVDHRDAPCCKNELQNTGLHRLLVVQGKIPVEVVHELILDSWQVIGYQSDTLLDAELLEASWQSTFPVHIIQRGKYVNCQTLDVI